MRRYAAALPVFFTQTLLFTPEKSDSSTSQVTAAGTKVLVFSAFLNMKERVTPTAAAAHRASAAISQSRILLDISRHLFPLTFRSLLPLSHLFVVGALPKVTVWFLFSVTFTV